MSSATIHIDVPKNLLLKANGGQGQVYANAQRAKHLRHKGALIGRDWINRHQPWQPYSHVDIDAGLWADDDYQHLRRRTYTMGPPTRKTGLWRVSIHITPITREEPS